MLEIPNKPLRSTYCISDKKRTKVYLFILKPWYTNLKCVGEEMI